MTTARRLPALLLPALALVAAGAAPGPAGATSPASAPASAPAGQYVEARTASVFAGACHYNGERVTDGKSAVAAWSIACGAFDGVDLSNTRVVAAVASEQNLADDAPRQTVLTVDAPTDAAAAAAARWVRTQATGLGDVVAVRRASVRFVATPEETRVTAAGFAAMTVRPMPDAACCTQPQLVWYTPLAAVEGRRVGYTVTATSTAPSAPQWQRGDENSAFYGRFGPPATLVAAAK